jgi:hypothetical protein
MLEAPKHLLARDHELLRDFDIPELEELVKGFEQSHRDLSNQYLATLEELNRINRVLMDLERLDLGRMDEVRLLVVTKKMDELRRERKPVYERLKEIARRHEELVLDYVNRRRSIYERIRYHFDRFAG